MRSWLQSDSIVAREIGRSKTGEWDSDVVKNHRHHCGLRPRTRTKDVSL